MHDVLVAASPNVRVAHVRCTHVTVRTVLSEE